MDLRTFGEGSGLIKEGKGKREERNDQKLWEKEVYCCEGTFKKKKMQFWKLYEEEVKHRRQVEQT